MWNSISVLQTLQRHVGGGNFMITDKCALFDKQNTKHKKSLTFNRNELIIYIA